MKKFPRRGFTFAISLGIPPGGAVRAVESRKAIGPGGDFLVDTEVPSDCLQVFGSISLLPVAGGTDCRMLVFL
jgi:hypothetical protein